MAVKNSLHLPEVLDDLVAKASPDLLKELVSRFVNALMSAEADAMCGAGWGEVSPERVNRRNGYRSRPWDTRAGSIDVKIPKRRRDGGRVCSRRALAQVLEVLDEHGVGRAGAGEAPASPGEALLSSFERFLLRERAVALSTASVYVARARRFLAWCAPELASLRASDVTGSVLRESESQSVSATKLFVTALRSFLRFSYIGGLTTSDLSGAALSVARRRLSWLPMGVDSKTAAALLRSCDRRRAKSRRDYAMLLMLLRLGLRAGEVARLRLDDVDWRAGEVVVHGKGRQEDRLPLPADVGEAVAAYLKRGRQNGTGHREVFLRAVPRSARSGRTGFRASSAVPACGRGCPSSGRTGSGTHWLASWPAPGRRCPRSPRSSATGPSPPQRSTPVST
jgi:site-specific recombinase XerD